MIFGTDVFGEPFDGVAGITKTAEYSMAGEMVANGTKTYSFSAKIKETVPKYYRMGGRLGIEPPSYQMAGYLVYDANDPRLASSIIDAFFWCYAKQYNNVQREIDLIPHRLKLDYASSDDLDEYWGNVLNLRRRATESDANYRARLATHIRIITSSGTKPNIEAIIDRIIGITGGTNCETVGFATIKLRWNSLDAILAAKAADTLITEAMDRTVACGVSWSTAYPYATYEMGWYRSYETLSTYEASGAISRLRGHNYHMAGGLWESGSETYDCGGAIAAIYDDTYRMVGRAIATGLATYVLAGKLQAMTGTTRTEDYYMAYTAAHDIRRFYAMAGAIEA